MHHARHESMSAEDLGPLSEHRMTVPATIWAAGLAFACLAALFDAPSAPEAATAQPAPAAAAPTPGRG